MYARYGLIFILSSLMSGCNALYNAAEAPYAQRRTEALLAEYKISHQDMDCQMMNTTRNFGCWFKANTKDMQKLASGLNLVQGSPERTRQRYLHTLYPQNCENISPFDENLNAPRFLLYENKDRQFKAVPGIEYMVLYLDSQTQTACVQASHSLG